MIPACRRICLLLVLTVVPYFASANTAPHRVGENIRYDNLENKGYDAWKAQQKERESRNEKTREERESYRPGMYGGKKEIPEKKKAEEEESSEGEAKEQGSKKSSAEKDQGKKESETESAAPAAEEE